MLAFVLAAAASVSVASAATITDFTTSPVEFVYPPPRGFAADTASVYPCGGIDPSATRTSFPMSGGEISLSSETLATNLNILYVNETDPTLFHDFSTYTDSILDISEGDYCTTSPDFTTVGYAAGENVTLLVIYQFYGNTTYYYHCADVTLVDNTAYTATDATCTNSSIVLDLAPLDDSLVLNGENFSDDAAGENGQYLSFSSTPTASATAEVTASIITSVATPSTTVAYSHAAASSGASAASSAAAVASSAAASASASSAGLPTVAGGAVGAIFATVVLAVAYIL